MIRSILLAVAITAASSAPAMSVGSKHAIVIDEGTGKVVFEKLSLIHI